jgi:hypothetical protein
MSQIGGKVPFWVKGSTVWCEKCNAEADHNVLAHDLPRPEGVPNAEDD